MTAQEPKQDGKQYVLNLTLAGFAGQVGFLTLIIIIGALIGGLWLDQTLRTKPLFTILILLASVPVTIFVMYRVAMGFVTRIKPGAQARPEPAQEKADHP
ncbi:MAG: AtpZ/AtpI family protein [Chloroflexi bacterium]|nr:AtpZ/AtpI family protein [Chloroflexota bacterium]MBI3763173.1 AtpZ/AtpI family protein [Chloroflexota bacterium]